MMIYRYFEKKMEVLLCLRVLPEVISKPGRPPRMGEHYIGVQQVVRETSSMHLLQRHDQ